MLIEEKKELSINLVYIGHFFSHYFGLILPAVFPFLILDLPFTLDQLGMMIGLMALGSLLGVMPAGVIVDRFGAYQVLVVGSIPF